MPIVDEEAIQYLRAMEDTWFQKTHACHVPHIIKEEKRFKDVYWNEFPG
jgi:hypothetical protein